MSVCLHAYTYICNHLHEKCLPSTVTNISRIWGSLKHFRSCCLNPEGRVFLRPRRAWASKSQGCNELFGLIAVFDITETRGAFFEVETRQTTYGSTLFTGSTCLYSPAVYPANGSFPQIPGALKRCGKPSVHLCGKALSLKTFPFMEALGGHC